eukprot:2028826-Rhodomonas_salina.1
MSGEMALPWYQGTRVPGYPTCYRICQKRSNSIGNSYCSKSLYWVLLLVPVAALSVLVVLVESYPGTATSSTKYQLHLYFGCTVTGTLLRSPYSIGTYSPPLTRISLCKTHPVPSQNYQPELPPTRGT